MTIKGKGFKIDSTTSYEQWYYDRFGQNAKRKQKDKRKLIEKKHNKKHEKEKPYELSREIL